MYWNGEILPLALIQTKLVMTTSTEIKRNIHSFTISVSDRNAWNKYQYLTFSIVILQREDYFLLPLPKKNVPVDNPKKLFSATRTTQSSQYLLAISTIKKKEKWLDWVVCWFFSKMVCWNAFVSKKITSATYAAKMKQMAYANLQKTFLATG